MTELASRQLLFRVCEPSHLPIIAPRHITKTQRSWISDGIAFILLDLRQHPIELSRSNLTAAEFTDTGGIYFQRGAAIGAIQICAGRRRFSFAVTNKRPVFTPSTQVPV